MADQHGNEVAEEGVDRCSCGCKYWELDEVKANILISLERHADSGYFRDVPIEAVDLAKVRLAVVEAETAEEAEKVYNTALDAEKEVQ